MLKLKRCLFYGGGITMSGAVAIKSKPNYSDKKSSVIISFKRKQNSFSLRDEFKEIDRDLKMLEDKYVSPVIWKDEKEQEEKERLILDHYNLRTNNNIKNIDANLEFILNDCSPMEVTLLGIVMEVNSPHSLKALSPIAVTR